MLHRIGYCVVRVLSIVTVAQLGGVLGAHGAVRLAREGRTDYRVVQAAQATKPELFAAQELTNFLQRVTGASFAVVSEAEMPQDAPGIYVGWTDYAASQGVAAEELGQEEWVLRTVGDDVILAGGRPRGTMYAVYEFLEDHVGCHWLDQDTAIIPSRPTLEIGSLDVQDKPWFWQRAVHSPTGTPDDQWRFMIRNKNFRYDFRGRRDHDFFPEGAFGRVSSRHTGVHSFSDFVNARDWFETRPEYFALGADGKRIPAYDGSGPGQLCLTHPDVLRLTEARLREFIALDREEAAAQGVPPPRLYWITQNDKYHAHCQCPTCQAIARREGGESGPLIAFVNAVAEQIEPDHPDLLVGTIAYNLTSTPPEHLRPRHNVLIGWCDVYSKCDGIRPLSHPLNAENYSEIVGWGKVAPRLGIGDDYWTALSYYKYFPTPFAMIECVASDLKLFADQGAETFFCESGDYVNASQQFIPLKFWLAYQLLVDPHQPAEPLITTFMTGYFGDAATPMYGYLRYQRKRIDADAQFKMLRSEPFKLAYLDVPFFATSQALFDQAEARVAPDSLEAKHVAVERFTLDAALLYLWPWLERKLPAGERLPFDREELIRRYGRGYDAFVDSRYSAVYTHWKQSLNTDGKLQERMIGLFRDPQLPDRFRDLPRRDVADFNWLTFSQIRPRQMFVPDDEAAGGMTATFTERSRIQKAEEGGDEDDVAAEEQYRRPLIFGVTGGPEITLAPEDVPQDENYHLYELGRIMVQPKTMVWALEGKRLGVTVDRVYEPDAKGPQANEWNVFISLKVAGPAYVKDSTATNGAWMDRVILVKPQPGEGPSELALKYQQEQERRAALRPRIRVPRLGSDAGGDPLKVDWIAATAETDWMTLDGTQTERKVEASFAHDGTCLYVRLKEELDPETLDVRPEIFGGDDWEFLFAPKRGAQPYRQFSVSPAGKRDERAYGEGAWESGAQVISDTPDDAWIVHLAFPLASIVEDGLSAGDTFYMNILRGGKENLVWSPTFDDGFHALGQLGEVVLEK